MKIQVRQAGESDFFRTEFITREAFWNVYKPGCDEHLVLHNLRKSICYVPELDLVAESENAIIGHILSSKANVTGASGNEHTVLCAGPLSVLPEFQKQGIGSLLISESVKIARDKGFAGIILFGNPDYYHRFGFMNAKEFQITTKDNQNFEPFMALELQTNSLAKVNGRFFADSAFEVKPEELNEFDKKFPIREKKVTDKQLWH